MQLTDAEIREILIRRKKAQIRRKKRRRRRFVLLLLLIIIIIIIAFILLRGHPGILGAGSTDQSGADDAESARGVIFIDPGHGGADPGSDDDADRYEKDDTLKLGLAVRDELIERGFKVEMSRTEDETVDRSLRGQLANEAGAQLFISIHRNKADTNGSGVEGFIPKSDDANSRLLGENIMHALSQQGFEERTIRAGTLNNADEDYEENAAAVMPSVLIEVGFLSSEYDNELFDVHLVGNAKAIAKAIDDTFMSIYEPELAAQTQAAEEFARETASKTVEPLNQAVQGTSLASDWIYSVSEDN